jgi:hypothetical protein
VFLSFKFSKNHQENPAVPAKTNVEMAFTFQPGRFQPVIEILRSEDLEPFEDEEGTIDLATDLVSEVTQSTVDEFVAIPDTESNCFENLSLCSEVPAADSTALCRMFSLDDDLTIASFYVYACPCFLGNYDVLEVPYSPAYLESVRSHSCSTCRACLVFKHSRPGTLWIDVPGYDPGPIRRSTKLGYRHPSVPDSRLLFPRGHALKNRPGYIDKFSVTTREKLSDKPPGLNRPMMQAWKPASAFPAMHDRYVHQLLFG